MSTSSTYNIETENLEIGSTLPFDLRDPEGNIVHKTGLPITQRLLDRLHSLGVSTVTVRGESKEPCPSALLSSFFGPAVLGKITESIDTSISDLSESIENLLSGQPIQAHVLNQHVDSFVSQAANDTSAVIAVLTQQSVTADADLVRRVAERSTCQSFWGVTIATSMGLTDEQVALVGTSALLSDISLATHPDWFDSTHMIKAEVFERDDYLEHPSESSLMLLGSGQFDDEVIECVAQSHEMVDGTGFPSRLTCDSIPTASRVLAVSEIYCSLTSPQFLSTPFLEADVLAYLLYHASKGRIDRAVLKGFIKCLSMYPIGSLVRLDDETHAIVVQPNVDNPFQPMVKLFDETGKVKDLSISQQQIVGPAIEKSPNRRRIEKSKLDSILWRPAV